MGGWTSHVKSILPLPPFLLPGPHGIVDKKPEDPLFLCECCVLHVSPPGRGGNNNSMLLSIFQPIPMDCGSFTETPAAAAAWGSSPYLIQFVNTGADGSEFAVWDPTNCKHPIKDAPVVDLGEREQHIRNYDLKKMLQQCPASFPCSFKHGREYRRCLPRVFFAICNYFFPFLGAELLRVDQIAQLTSNRPGQSHHISF